MNRLKKISLKRRMMSIFMALAIPGVLVLVVYTASAMNTMKMRLINAGEFSLQLFEKEISRQMNAVETYMVDLALHNEEFKRLGEKMDHTQAYLNGYEVAQGFSGILGANEALMGIMLYSVPNQLFIAKYGQVAGGGPQQKLRAKQVMQEEVMALADVGPMETENWFVVKLEERTYGVRVVRYRSVYIAATIDLGLLIDKAIKTYGFEGSLAFVDEGGNLLVGNIENMPSAYNLKEATHKTLKLNGQSYLMLLGEFDRFSIFYLLPIEGAQGAVAPLETLLIGCLILLLAAIPFMWIYVRATVFVPLNSLVLTMEKIGAGELTARSGNMYKNKEFEQVNDTFNDMIGQITALKIDSYERQLEAERSEMEALRMQIRPHFVLNCLKNVYALAQTGRLEEIQTLILLLSRHLRYILANTNDTVSLEKELELCQNYVELTAIGQACTPFCSVETDN
ncbi:MAG: histidine kinase, partial [Oscillospiraceae bacterium]|nr:histidine kinase [Oscillospiraceae bacterium]